jgi:dolichol-phosphate mannosyltransferase
MPRGEFAAPSPHFDASARRPVLSVVIPLYEEQGIVSILVERVARVLDELDVDAEVILVDDGSADGTLREIARAHERDARFVGVALSRNFGHQIAISAGLVEARGEAVVVMDGDLQDPPEAIAALWLRWQEGYDVVYAIRASRPESAWKRLAYSGFYRIMRRWGSVAIPLDAGDFGIMSRRVVDLLNAMPERRRFLRGLRAWVGFRQTGIPIDRAERHAGRPKFTTAKLLGLALDGLIGFGEAPLRWAGAIGVLMLLASLLGTLGATVSAVIYGALPPGWAWALGLAGFLGGVQLLSMAILGEYVVRIFQDVNGRPLYVVRRRIGLPSSRARGSSRRKRLNLD